MGPAAGQDVEVLREGLWVETPAAPPGQAALERQVNGGDAGLPVERKSWVYGDPVAAPLGGGREE